jgi:hypothetical protein
MTAEEKEVMLANQEQDRNLDNALVQQESNRDQNIIADKELRIAEGWEQYKKNAIAIDKEFDIAKGWEEYKKQDKAIDKELAQAEYNEKDEIINKELTQAEAQEQYNVADNNQILVIEQALSLLPPDLRSDASSALEARKDYATINSLIEDANKKVSALKQNVNNSVLSNDVKVMIIDTLATSFVEAENAFNNYMQAMVNQANQLENDNIV